MNWWCSSSQCLLNALKAQPLTHQWTEPPATAALQWDCLKASPGSLSNLQVSPKGKVEQAVAYIPLSVRFFRMTRIVRISRIRGFGIHSNGELALAEGAGTVSP